MLTVSIIFYLQFLGKRSIEFAAPLVDASMEIKLELALAHLTHLQQVTNKSKTMSDVEKHLHSALWYTNAMLNGGSNEEGTYIALDDDHLSTLIIGVENQIKKLDDLVHS